MDRLEKDNKIDLDKVMAEFGLSESDMGSEEVNNMNFSGSSCILEEHGIKSIDEINDRFLGLHKGFGAGKPHLNIWERLAAGTLALFMLITILFSGMAGSILAEPDYGNILNFERINPVYSNEVDNGTVQNKLDLPQTVRAVLEFEPSESSLKTTPKADADIGIRENTSETSLDSEDHEEEEQASEQRAEPLSETNARQTGFNQMTPKVNTKGEYDYYRYGYVAPRNENKLRKAGKPVIYTVYYAEKNKAYRVYGTWDNINENFYACDKSGHVFGVVKDIPVTWVCKEYKAKIAGSYTFTAKIEGYTYEGEKPTAQITVKAAGQKANDKDGHQHSSEEAECTCGTTTDKHDKSCLLWRAECNCEHAETGHIKGCPLWSPKCSCPKGSSGHTDKACPYYVPLADCDCGIDEDSRPWEHRKGCKYFSPVACTCEGGKHDPANSDCLLYTPAQSRSLNGGTGARDAEGDNFMKSQIPTSGNLDYTDTYVTGTVPGAWKDYINTIWMNKAFNKFAWTFLANMNLPVAGWAWNGTVANGSTGTTADNANKIPAAVSGIWTVYSGQQLRYALLNFTSGQTIRLGSDISLNGSYYDWDIINLNDAKNLILDGNNKTIYNLGCVTTTLSNCGFIRNMREAKVFNIDFVSAKLISGQSFVYLFGTNSLTRNRTFTDVTIRDSLFCSTSVNGYVAPLGHITASILREVGNETTAFTRCFSEKNYLYGSAHVNGMTGGSNYGTVRYCYTKDNLICGTGGHSAGFMGCQAFGMDIKYCFSSNEMYGTGVVSGFFGLGNGKVTDSFSTGKLEGYNDMGGFSAQSSSESDNPTTIERCYSTILVGLRTESKNVGGFHARFVPGVTGGRSMKDCYAAGETGNTNTDLKNPISIGGFYGTKYDMDSTENCYYDKQTTAMREWNAGNIKTVSGVTGCLTSTTAKAGTGLASGTYGTSSDPGFKGFSDNAQWIYKPEHYPQLNIFANASPAASAWGTQACADSVKAWSAASTATVFLDTWDNGYDWDNDGVRSANKNSYNRDTGSAGHAGNQYTYDTVREIVTNFKTTNITANTTTWTQLIPGGAPAQITDKAASMTVTNTIGIAGGKGTVNNPGMDWYKVSETVNGQTGFRPLRLISYMNIEAGGDKNVDAGDLYNHRTDVKLTMMDAITDNLVVGLDPSKLPDIGSWPAGSDQTPHDKRIWSTAKTNSYPDTTKFYAAPTTPTNFSASRDAWIYTEIWRAQKDASGNYMKDGEGNYMPEYSVKVTGVGTGNNLTIDERKWNGQEPLYADTSVGHKYIVTYYWMLSDGRYRTDYKIITIEPGHYDLTVDVFNLSGQTVNSTALYTGAAPDGGPNPDYHYSANPTAHAEALDNRYTTNVTAAWKKQAANTQIAKMQVTMKAADKTTVMGTAAITGNIKEGSQITIPVTYLYITTVDDEVQGKREITASQVVNITYTVQKDADGGYYLRFNKLANEPANEVPSAYTYGDRTGIPENTKAYINDLTYNVSVELWVTEAGKFSVQKILSSPAEEEEQFVFQVDYCGSSSAAGTTERTMYAVITIPAGQTTGAALFKDMPRGWYKVSELESNWRFKLLSGRLEEDNPRAVIDQVNAKVTMWIEGNHENYIYRNKRLDIPWVNGKANVTNHMPLLVNPVSPN